MNAIEMKCRREALGLSRDALADTLDVREQNITRWEFGKNPPRDWGWIDTALTRLEDYREELVAGLNPAQREAAPREGREGVGDVGAEDRAAVADEEGRARDRGGHDGNREGDLASGDDA